VARSRNIGTSATLLTAW